ncbi:MAG: hypothetical protein KatS3mg129_2061 [Leptospiraceae bacterium]|nr:MAG: hypothetical protein KatS3mg129_2061 [Leptospiraceae bacterium]
MLNQYGKYKIIFFLIFYYFLFTTNCSKNLEEKYLELEQRAKEAILKMDYEEIANVLEELNELEKEETEKKIHILDKSNYNNSIYYLTPSKNYFLFSKKDTIHIYYNNQIFYTEIKNPSELFSSFSGKYWVFRYIENNENCRNVFYRLNEDSDKSKLEFTKLFEYNNNCNKLIITDQGNIYEESENNIYLIQENIKVLKLKSNQFKQLFKKNPHFIYFYPIPYKGFWIFYGNAGYYDLYYYDEKQLYLLFKGVATPRIYYTTEDLFKEDVSPENYYFVFTGAAAQYTLTGFILPDKTWKSFNIEYNDKYVYIINQNVFLYKHDENLYILNPETEKEIQLPIKVKDFFVYKDSLILLTDKGLYVRKEPFSNLEKKIFVLKEELLYNIR